MLGVYLRRASHNGRKEMNEDNREPPRDLRGRIATLSGVRSDDTNDRNGARERRMLHRLPECATWTISCSAGGQMSLAERVVSNLAVQQVE